jgi:hypothetical protein
VPVRLGRLRATRAVAAVGRLPSHERIDTLPRRLIVLIAAAALGAGACSHASGGGQGQSGVDEINGCPLRPRASCPGRQLAGADLRAANLSEADLRDADLRRADFRRADLSNADLRLADLREANLSDARLVGARLAGADLRDAILVGADTTGADLSGASQCGLTRSDGALETAGCPSSTTTSPRSAFPLPPPAVDSLSVAPGAHCQHESTGLKLTVSWAWQNVIQSIITVDGIDVYRGGPLEPQSGSKALSFVCDGKPHEIKATVFNFAYPPGTKAITVSAVS